MSKTFDDAVEAAHRRGWTDAAFIGGITDPRTSEGETRRRASLEAMRRELAGPRAGDPDATEVPGRPQFDREPPPSEEQKARARARMDARAAEREQWLGSQQ